MKVIAVTGGIACGKTTLLHALTKLGAIVIDADAIARQLTLPGGLALNAIHDKFGEGVFTGDGALDRKALADIVFSDSKSRKTLNRILHPMINVEIQRQMALYRSAGQKLVFLDIPLLFEAHMQSLADEIWCAYAPPEEQLSRLMARDRIPRDQALKRIQSQMPLDEKAKLSHKVIDTSGEIGGTYQKAIALYENALREI